MQRLLRKPSLSTPLTFPYSNSQQSITIFLYTTVFIHKLSSCVLYKSEHSLLFSTFALLQQTLIAFVAEVQWWVDDTDWTLPVHAPTKCFMPPFTFYICLPVNFAENFVCCEVLRLYYFFPPPLWPFIFLSLSDYYNINTHLLQNGNQVEERAQ